MNERDDKLLVSFNRRNMASTVTATARERERKSGADRRSFEIHIGVEDRFEGNCMKIEADLDRHPPISRSLIGVFLSGKANGNVPTLINLGDARINASLCFENPLTYDSIPRNILKHIDTCDRFKFN